MRSQRWTCLATGIATVALLAVATSPAAASSGLIPATLNGVAPFGSSVLAVGADQQFFLTTPASGLPLAETLKGKRFQAIKIGPAHQLITLTSVARASKTRAWAVGYRMLTNGNPVTASERFNGHRWTNVHIPSPGQNSLLSAVIVAHGTPWAFGQTQADNFSAAKTLVERFTGGHWHVVASPSPSSLAQNLYSATTDSAGHVWAVGFYEDDTDFSNHALSIEDSGGAFHVVDTPSPGGPSGSKLEGVARSGGQLMAVGFYRDPATFAPRTLAERWDGSAWQVLPSASPGSQDDVLDGVTTAKGKPWAVGWYANSSCDRTLTERFSAGAWTTVKSPNVGGCGFSTGASNVLNAVAPDRHGTLYAVGARDTHTLVERNAGHGWKVVKSAD